eukprot:CAMPEP_0174964390 /NCGR_PEP_ID=MMETSP0004_2-20121128/5849_1 /TAXON_ID=420556 /ORGANISM="Ochromonas sp., Strain CCMP1393" /LENGTH=918 /DNA_ID=CAMNT_0016213101 /DNA_START=497 /DNA_END=3253 /DNA_ORIENTATION=+
MGYVTNRSGMEKMLDRIVGYYKSAPTADFIDSVQATMKTQLWHQSSHYVARMLKLYNHHVLHVCSSTIDLQAIHSRFEAFWGYVIPGSKQINSAAVEQYGELFSLRLEFYSSLAHMHNKFTASQRDGVSNNPYHDIARQAFEALTNDWTQLRSHSHSLQALGNCATIFDFVNAAASRYSTRMTSFRSHQRPAALLLDGGPSVGLSLSFRGVMDSSRKSISSLLAQMSTRAQYTQALYMLDSFVLTDHRTSNDLASIKPASKLESAHSSEYYSSMISRSKRQSPKEKLLHTLGQPAFDRGIPMRVLVSNDLGKGHGISYRQNHATLSGERTWLASLICEIMRSAVVELSGLDSVDQAPDDLASGHIFYELGNLYESLLQTARMHQLKPGPNLCAAYIDALRANLNETQTDTRTGYSDTSHMIGQKLNDLHWSSALAVAQSIVDSTDDDIGKSPEVCHALVQLLCTSSDATGSPDRAAVLKSIDVLQDMFSSKARIRPDTLCLILDAAVQSFDDASLSHLLVEFEQVVEQIPMNRSSQLIAMRSRIYANARLRRGYTALKLFREIRNLGVGPPVELRLYRWLLHALYNATPSTESEWIVAKNPYSTVEYLIRELKRDGHPLQGEMLAIALRPFTKAVQIARSQGGMCSVLDRMHSFVATHAPSLHRGSGMTEACLRELVKAHCIAGQEEEAIQLVDRAEEEYGIQVTALSYEPLMFMYGGIKGLTTVTEDLVTMLMNKSIPITDAVVVPMVLGHIRQGDLSEALDCIQDVYNLHRVRPTPSLWLTLLDASLSTGDVLEARRVVSLISRLYTSKEREELVGPKQNIRVSSEGGGGGVAAAAAAVEGEIRDRIPAQHHHHAASKSYWHPTGANNSNLSTGNQFLPMHGYLIKLGVPIGQRQRGVLSDEALSVRFAQNGLSLI